MPTVASSTPPSLSDSPLYLLAVLYSARKSQDRLLEEVTRQKLADLGVRLIFGDALPASPKRKGGGNRD
jgi:hypothetical protein